MSGAACSVANANTIVAAIVDFDTLKNDNIDMSQGGITLWYIDDQGAQQPVNLTVYDSFEMQVKTSYEATPDMTLTSGGGGLEQIGTNEIRVNAKVTAPVGNNVQDLWGRISLDPTKDRILWSGRFDVGPSVTPT